MERENNNDFDKNIIVFIGKHTQKQTILSLLCYNK